MADPRASRRDHANWLIPRCARRVVRGRVHGDESGTALVMAIAAVLLTGLLMGIVFSSVMFSVGHTTATRAQAASRASAEGGAQQVARYLLQNSASATMVCPATWNLEVLTDGLHYDVNEVSFQTVEGGAWSACSPSVGVPKLAHAVRVNTTGYSKTVGQAGNSRGNEATVEMVFVRPKATVFDKAIYGESYVNITNNIGLSMDPVVPGRPSTTLPADVVSPKGFFNCANMPVVQGSVYALQGAALSSNCRIKGDLYVDFTKQPIDKLGQEVGANVTIDGNLYVIGNLDVPSGFTVGGSTLIVGNLHIRNGGTLFAGATRVTGKFSANNDARDAFPTFLATGGVWDRTDVTTNWFSKITTEAMGARYREAQSTTGPEWVPPSVFNTVANPATSAETAALRLPMLTKSDPMWSTFAVGDWNAMTTGIRVGGVCDAHDYNAPIRILSDTQVDLTGCAPWSVQKLKIELSADLVVFVSDLRKGGDMTVVSGNAPGDETDRKSVV